MSDPIKTNGADRAPAETIFDQPAPDGHAKKMSEVLGEITWLLTQSPLHKRLFLEDLEWLVMTPVLLNQFRLYYAPDRPIGVVLWAKVDEETAAALSQGINRMRPQDWTSGDKAWVVEVISPFGGAQEMVDELKKEVFAEAPLWLTRPGPNGKPVVQTL